MRRIVKLSRRANRKNFRAGMRQRAINFGLWVPRGGIDL